jgi:hypothetical protein
MAEPISTRLAHAWNAFTSVSVRDDTRAPDPFSMGASYGVRPDRVRLRVSNERTIISSIYTRLSVDITSVDMRHVRLDDMNRYSEDIRSGLNDCLTVEANLDQAASMFRQDLISTLFDEGVVAIVPIDTDMDPEMQGSVGIRTMRVGRIVQWFPRFVKVSLYNDATGKREELTLAKSTVAIVENPFYSVMNEPNSTLQRLRRKLSILDAIDEQSGSGKLDVIIQLPYPTASEKLRDRAQQRLADIEFQLRGSQHGIAYADVNEKITQLNRPVENNLLKQVEYLTEMLYSELGLTAAIMNGTADEPTMLNYNNRTVKPILNAFVEEMRRKFLSKTARTQGQSIMYFVDPFKLVPISQIAEIADKFARNEILTSNEIRQAIGFSPFDDPKADTLVNSNMPQPNGDVPPDAELESLVEEDDGGDDIMNEAFDSVESSIDKVIAELEAELDDDN